MLQVSWVLGPLDGMAFVLRYLELNVSAFESWIWGFNVEGASETWLPCAQVECP